uniref:Ribosome assembly protein 3 n=1 Tax=Globisporangium ultimum (strain ATCC 200006 / CBS 805.95 / DAOM BR144) TaxID=431595 RepID=K3WH10_GLOUD
MASGDSSSSSATDSAKIVARYDKLLQALGEDPFQPASVFQRTEDVSKSIDDAQAADERTQLLAAAAQKSLRCAKLIEQALDASAKFNHVQQKVAQAHKDHNDDESSDDGDEDVDMDEDGESEQTVLLLEDLVAVGDEMQDISKKYAHLGVASKTARASRELLSIADQNLQESMDALATTGYGNSSARVQEEFRDLYMEEFTTAFGDDLDQFRQEERFESKDVTYLISCIHAGGDVFSPLQKKLFVESVNANKS